MNRARITLRSGYICFSAFPYQMRTDQELKALYVRASYNIIADFSNMLLISKDCNLNKAIFNSIVYIQRETWKQSLRQNGG